MNEVSTHSRPKAAGAVNQNKPHDRKVSTHSRPKAAGFSERFDMSEKEVSTHSRPKAAGCCLNECCHVVKRFNTQPPEGGWTPSIDNLFIMLLFQHTAARRRLGLDRAGRGWTTFSFNTQPPEGGWHLSLMVILSLSGFQHTAARRRLAVLAAMVPNKAGFQHTAARRRLGSDAASSATCSEVSTHSRPKAAGCLRLVLGRGWFCFNTQPPEGGWAIR